MSDKTGIEWADATWNPVVGCSKTSPGCDNCYAIRQATRIVHMGGKAAGSYAGTVADDDWTGAVKCLPERLDQPLRWKRPRRIFVCSMSDLFHPAVPLDFILQVWSTMANAPQHTFQVLTKRPQRMQRIVDAIAWTGGVDGEPWEAYSWPGTYEDDDGRFFETYEEDLDGGGEVPLANVWLGTSIENDTYSWRANYLRETPAAVRWISAEPLLGPLPSLDLTGIDWVVVGGESGPGARPMEPDWARDLLDRCHGRTSACIVDGCSLPDPVAYLFKQWGNWGPDGYQASKKANGRLLDGQEWNEYPA